MVLFSLSKTDVLFKNEFSTATPSHESNRYPVFRVAKMGCKGLYIKKPSPIAKPESVGSITILSSTGPYGIKRALISTFSVTVKVISSALVSVPLSPLPDHFSNW